MGYRFKTEEEFIEEYGEGWRREVRESWISPHMDEWFGKDVPFQVDPTHAFQGQIGDALWCTSIDMMTDRPLKNSVPSYTPRKIDRKLMETLSPYLPFYVWCDNKEKYIEFENFLHKNGWKWDGGSEYLLRNGGYSVITFGDFDKKRKCFSGWSMDRTNSPRMQELKKYTYPEDFQTIQKELSTKPNYQPRKIDRQLLENIKPPKNFRIYCENRGASVELEDFLHRAGWLWNDGHKYYIRRDGSITGVVINEFDFDKKYFSGFKSKTNPGYIEGMYNWPEDILKIRALFDKPNYNPKHMNKNIDTLDENAQYSITGDLLLEKSSLTKLGVPREVMQPLQKDFAIPADAQWERVTLKRDVEKIFRDGEKELVLQIETDSIKAFVSYFTPASDRYFIDSYLLDESGWGGYEQLPREEVTLTQLLYQINSKSLLYHLKSPFSLIRQHKRKLMKKEKSFMDFTEKFKKDFLENFDSVLKRIVGNHYKDAKQEIKDKARQIEIENQMMLSGLDDPLAGPNSLTILDQFLTEFEDAYSDFFGERLDIEELSKNFTREKMMTSFMYYIYTGKLLDR